MSAIPRVVLAGGSGFVGHALATALVSKDYEVVVLGRGASHRTGSIQHVQWDGKTVGEWTQNLVGARAVVNLTGKNVNCRHTPQNQREIIDSRVNSVRVLGEAIARSARAPKAFVQASAVGIYGDAGDCWCDENAPHGNGFLADVSRAWEGAFETVETPGMRKTLLRLGPVLGPRGGLLEPLGRLTCWFLGGQVGSGRQYFSWIHVNDLVRMFLAAIERDDITGIFNAVAPSPVTNAELMRELRRALRRPWSPPVPAFAAKIGARIMGTDASLALTGQRCTPKHFLEREFEFEFPELRSALKDLFTGD
jgi:uncharacterized protein (TIGR01777 family)